MYIMRVKWNNAYKKPKTVTQYAFKYLLALLLLELLLICMGIRPISEQKGHGIPVNKKEEYFSNINLSKQCAIPEDGGKAANHIWASSDRCYLTEVSSCHIQGHKKLYGMQGSIFWKNWSIPFIQLVILNILPLFLYNKFQPTTKHVTYSPIYIYAYIK